MENINHLIEENEYLKTKLTKLNIENAELKASRRDALKVVKDCLKVLRAEKKNFVDSK